MTTKQCQSCWQHKALECFRMHGLHRANTCNKCRSSAEDERLADIQAAARRQRTGTSDRYRREVITLTARHRKFLARVVVGGGE